MPREFPHPDPLPEGEGEKQDGIRLVCNDRQSMTRHYPDRPIVGVLGVVRRDGRVLLVQRARPPNAGKWGFPGGVQELGETIFEAVARELMEETGLVTEPVEVLTTLDVIERDGEGRVRSHYALIAVLAEWRSGEVRIDDEALDFNWLTVDEVEARNLAMLPSATRIMAIALSKS
jgi:8-oxo-dGTP diphosphatase